MCLPFTWWRGRFVAKRCSKLGGGGMRKFVSFIGFLYRRTFDDIRIAWTGSSNSKSITRLFLDVNGNCISASLLILLQSIVAQKNNNINPHDRIVKLNCLVITAASIIHKVLNETNQFTYKIFWFLYMLNSLLIYVFFYTYYYTNVPFALFADIYTNASTYYMYIIFFYCKFIF